MRLTLPERGWTCFLKCPLREEEEEENERRRKADERWVEGKGGLTGSEAASHQESRGGDGGSGETIASLSLCWTSVWSVYYQRGGVTRVSEMLFILRSQASRKLSPTQTKNNPQLKFKEEIVCHHEEFHPGARRCNQTKMEKSEKTSDFRGRVLLI